MELFKYLLTDMKQPISYIPQGILTGVVAVMVMYLVWKRRKAESDTKKLAVFFMLFLYGTVLAVQTFFSRTPCSQKVYRTGTVGNLGNYLAGPCIRDRECDHVSAVGNSASSGGQEVGAVEENFSDQCRLFSNDRSAAVYHCQRIQSAG